MPDELSASLMPLFNAIRCVVAGLLVLAGVARPEIPLTASRATSEAVVSDTGPRDVRGDFDGDGRPDVAVIRHELSGASVDILLAGSVTWAHLPADIVGLVPSDIDHDGDLDLVGLTRTGKLFIWLNDGRGRFARQRAHHQHHETNVGSELRPSASVVMNAPAPAATLLVHRVVSSTAITARVHTAARRVRLNIVALPILRGPPAART